MEDVRLHLGAGARQAAAARRRGRAGRAVLLREGAALLRLPDLSRLHAARRGDRAAADAARGGDPRHRARPRGRVGPAGASAARRADPADPDRRDQRRRTSARRRSRSAPTSTCRSRSTAARCSTRSPRCRRARSGRSRVLSIDDEEVARYLVRQCLPPPAFEIIEAGDGADRASSAREAEQPDVVLLDLVMPGMDGWQVLRRAARRGADARHSGRHPDLPGARGRRPRARASTRSFAVAVEAGPVARDARRRSCRPRRRAATRAARRSGRRRARRYNHQFAPKEQETADERSITRLLRRSHRNQDEAGIVQRWIDRQLAAPSFRSDRISKTELTEQSRRFLSAAAAVASGPAAPTCSRRPGRTSVRCSTSSRSAARSRASRRRRPRCSSSR